VRDGKVQLVPVRIGRDYGDQVEVIAGLKPSDPVIASPSDSLFRGMAVRVSGRTDG